MRGIERLVIVLIGGMAIYLGYRLFLAVKAEAEGEAKISLPHDVTVMVSRVGPGVFFALFGSMVVIASLYFSIALQRCRALLQRHGAQPVSRRRGGAARDGMRRLAKR